MKTYVRISVWLVLLALGLWSCKEDQGPTQGEGQVTGRVTDESNGNPLAQVNIVAQTEALGTQTASTDADGNYSFTFQIDSAVNVSLDLTKSGYDNKSVDAQIRPGAATPLNIQLTPKSPIVGGGGGGSGLAQTIAFLGSNPTEISVYGVGGLETSILGFEVRDSLGLPIDAAHAVTLTFTALGGPNGGEYISPLQAATNASGRAFTTFNSGIRSGVVQVLASATVAGRTITTSPIRLVIDAGFPDQTHFTVSPAKFNFPTLGIAGNRDGISVLVGDIYSNPVVQNTAVYFRTSAGVIQASVFTTPDGEGIADLISGNPSPFGGHAAPDSGDGYHYVVARTIGQNGATVQDSVLLLWSGRAISPVITPDTFTIGNGGYRDFQLHVSDYLGHPLAAGTTITVQAIVPPPPDPNAPVNQVLMVFGQEGVVVLEDFIGRGEGSTEFHFRVSDGTFGAVPQPTSVSVTVTITGPNGNAYTTINGIVN